MSNHLSADVIRARVVVGDVDTPYCRCGRGELVVLLTDDESLVTAAFAHLPRDLCLIVPERIVSKDVDFSAWLTAFLDALGVQRVTLAASPSFLEAARAYASFDSDRIARVGPVDGNGDTSALLRSIVDLSIADPAPPP
jgi:hypothetical protein